MSNSHTVDALTLAAKKKSRLFPGFYHIYIYICTYIYIHIHIYIYIYICRERERHMLLC